MTTDVWIEKDREMYLLRYMNNHSGIWKSDIISILNQNDFDFMIEHFTLMSLNNNAESLPYYYYFPTRGVKFVELRVQMIKHKNFFYTLDLNLGSYRLSEMDQIEFEELLRDLNMLQTRNNDAKVYFPYRRDR